MVDNPLEQPPTSPGFDWDYYIGTVAFRVFLSLHWALVGGLGWGVGITLGSMTALPGAETIGGSTGLALVLLAFLTMNLAKWPKENTAITLALCGGVAFAYGSIAYFDRLDRQLLLILAAIAGFLVAALSCIMRQWFAPVRLLSACWIALVASALFAGIGSAVEGLWGWAAAGGISLTCVAVLAEARRLEPMVEYENGQLVRVIPRSEMCLRTLRQSWSPTWSLAWGWNGALAGLAGYYWSVWAADYLPQDALQYPLLILGGLAAFMIVATRLALLRFTPAQKK